MAVSLDVIYDFMKEMKAKIDALADAQEKIKATLGALVEVQEDTQKVVSNLGDGLEFVKKSVDVVAAMLTSAPSRPRDGGAARSNNDDDGGTTIAELKELLRDAGEVYVTIQNSPTYCTPEWSGCTAMVNSTTAKTVVLDLWKRGSDLDGEPDKTTRLKPHQLVVDYGSTDEEEEEDEDEEAVASAASDEEEAEEEKENEDEDEESDAIDDQGDDHGSDSDYVDDDDDE